MSQRSTGRYLLDSICAVVLWFTGGLTFALLIFSYMVVTLVIPPRRMQWVLRGMCRIILVASGQRLVIQGEPPRADGGPFIYMFNHESLFDVFLVYGLVRPPTTAIGALKQFSWPFWGTILRRYGAIPIDRNHLNPAIASLNAAEEALSSGTSLVISPEGTRTMTGKMGPFKKGPFHVALHTQATLFPMGLVGAYRAKNKADWRIYPGTIVVRFGEPVTASQYENLSVEQLRDIMREKILTLANQTDS